MATIYVRKSGNDTTGTGLTGAPYLTINKALTVAVAGDTILVGDGTYAENSGSGRLTFSTAYASEVVIASESGDPRNVTISGTTSDVRFTGAANVTFRSVGFQNVADTVVRAVRLDAGTLSNIRFRNCRFLILSSTTQVNTAVDTAWTGAGGNFTGIQFIGCTVDQTGIARTQGIYLNNTGAGSLADSFVIHDNRIRLSGYALRLDGLTNVQVTGNDLMTLGTTATDHCLLLGVDNTTGTNPCSGVIANNTVYNDNGHSLIVAAGCNGVDVIANHVTGGKDTSIGLGIVVKQNSNVRVIRNTVVAKGSNGLYFKAATNCQAQENDVYVVASTGVGLRVGNDPANSVACSNLSVRRNRIHAPKGTALAWGAVADDSGGSVCDENVYVVDGTGVLGTVRGNTVTKTSELRSAWSGYNRPNNDRNSRHGANHPVFAGTPLADLP